MGGLLVVQTRTQGEHLRVAKYSLLLPSTARAIILDGTLLALGRGMLVGASAVHLTPDGLVAIAFNCEPYYSMWFSNIS